MIPSFFRIEPSIDHSEASFWKPVAQSTWILAPVWGMNSMTAETTQSLRQSAVSSEIILEVVNWDNFSLQTKTSWQSFLITSAENDDPKVSFGVVDSENNSLGSFLKEVQVTQLSETSSVILAWPGL